MSLARLAVQLCLASLVFLLAQLFFFFNDTATTEIYTLSLHDALPIWPHILGHRHPAVLAAIQEALGRGTAFGAPDRKSTRLNSSHQIISYAVFCLKKKNIGMCLPQ